MYKCGRKCFATCVIIISIASIIFNLCHHSSGRSHCLKTVFLSSISEVLLWVDISLLVWSTVLFSQSKCICSAYRGYHFHYIIFEPRGEWFFSSALIVLCRGKTCKAYTILHSTLTFTHSFSAYDSSSTFERALWTIIAENRNAYPYSHKNLVNQWAKILSYAFLV